MGKRYLRAGVSFPPSFWKFYRNNFAAYTDTRIRMKILSFDSSSTGMLQVNQDIGIPGPLFGFQDKNLPEKPDTFLHGNTRIQGYQTLCGGEQGENQRLGRPSTLKTMGIRGYKGYEGYELLLKNQTLFS